MNDNWFEVVIALIVFVIKAVMVIGAIWFWCWLADYRVGCMFDSSPRACANLAKMAEVKND